MKPKILLMSYRKVATRIKKEWQYFEHYRIHNFAFIHINKTAGRSVGKALKIPFEHKTAHKKIEELGLPEWNQRFTFTFVRNPWDRVVSLYHYRVKTNQTNLKTDSISFENWINLCYVDRNTYYYNTHKMFMPQFDWIADTEGNILVDFVGRFENLQQDFEHICDHLNKKSTLKHLHRSQRKKYHEYYNSETKKIIQDYYRKDIEFFGYDF